MRIVTVLGTGPEIIRLSRIIEKLDRLAEHILVHTGQNFDRQLSDVFFEELQVRKPNHQLGVDGDTLAEQIAQILLRSEAIFRRDKPDRLLILGDTNSALCAIIVKRMGIPVFHMEAGNRCYDDRVPEEINRRLIDHCSDILMPYTERSRANLLRHSRRTNLRDRQPDPRSDRALSAADRTLRRFAEPAGRAARLFPGHAASG